MPQPVSVTIKATKFAAQVLRRVVRLQPHISCGDRDRPAVRHRVAGIDDQVDQRELQFMNIDGDRPDASPDIDHQLDIAAGRTGQQIAERREALAQAYDGGVEGLAPRKGEQLAGQRLAARRRDLDRLDRAQILRVAQPLLQQSARCR